VKPYPQYMKPHITLFMLHLAMGRKPEWIRAFVERAEGYKRLTEEQMDQVENIAINHAIAAQKLKESCPSYVPRRK
jgi:hypothetical protein